MEKLNAQDFAENRSLFCGLLPVHTVYAHAYISSSAKFERIKIGSKCLN